MSTEKAPPADDTEPVASAPLDLAKQVGTFVSKLSNLDVKPRMVQFEIDDIVYTNVKLPTSIGLDIWPRITALLGSAFTRAVATGDMDGVSADMFVRVAQQAMRDGLVPLVKDLLMSMQCNALCGNTKDQGELLPKFDDHFAGEYGHLMKVCAFAIAHNLRGPTYGGR